jgi:hypothetical protein
MERIVARVLRAHPLPCPPLYIVNHCKEAIVQMSVVMSNMILNNKAFLSSFHTDSEAPPSQTRG